MHCLIFVNNNEETLLIMYIYTFIPAYRSGNYYNDASLHYNTTLSTSGGQTKVRYIILRYPCERGPLGGTPYIGPRLGDEPIFEVSVSHLDLKERPGKLPTLSS